MTIINVVVKTDAFFVFIFAYFINGERIVPVEVVGIFVCFFTVYAISKDRAGEEDADDSKWSVDDRNMGIALAVLVAAITGVVAVLNRRLKSIPASMIMFYQGILGFTVFGIYLTVEAIQSDT